MWNLKNLSQIGFRVDTGTIIITNTILFLV